MLVDQPIPNLHGGVSQQSPQARFLNQVDEQTNCIADPVKGLSKRPPLEHIRRIITGSLTNPPGFFRIDRDRDNRFVAMVESGVVRVWDTVTGLEKAVTDTTDGSYLQTTTPVADISSVSVADYTFLVNSKVTVAKLADVSPSIQDVAVLFVRASNYSRTYRVTVRNDDDSLVGNVYYTTPNGSDPSHAAQIDNTYIAGQLQTQLNALTGFTASNDGALISLTRDSAGPFKVEVEDGQGGEALKVFHKQAQRFSDLPAKYIDGQVLEIVGDNTSGFDNYWVKYANGIWEETIAPGLETKLDPSTLPVALIRQPDDTFTVEELPWVDRVIGDDDNNPFPSFVGQKINSLFYFRNRLGFLADENVILSKAGDYFNFFRTTATQLLDDDRIDTPAADNSGDGSSVSVLRHAVAFDKKLVLFSDNAQFVLDSKGLLTPFEAEIDPVTAFACSPNCRPISAGRYVYFAFDREGATGIRQFFLDTFAQTEDAQEVTAHVPTYLPANLVAMTGTTLENILLARSTDQPSKLYAYEYFFSGQDQLQSAWGEWAFEASNTVHYVTFFDNIAYVVLERSDGFHLERIRMRPDLTDTSLDYFTLLDHRVTGLTGTYDPINDRTEYTLPYTPPAGITAFTLSNTGVHAPGVEIVPDSILGDIVRLPGNVTTYNVVFGYKYSQFVRFSRPFYMQPSQNGLVANTQAVLKLRDYSVDFTGSGYFDLEFFPKHRVGYVKSFTGQVLGSTATDSKPLDDGAFRIKTPTKNQLWGLTLTNDSPFPCTLTSASWRGVVESRSQRV